MSTPPLTPSAEPTSREVGDWFLSEHGSLLKITSTGWGVVGDMAAARDEHNATLRALRELVELAKHDDIARGSSDRMLAAIRQAQEAMK